MEPRTLLRHLRDRLLGKHLHDPVFGPLRYSRGTGTWDGRAPATVFGGDVRVTIFAGPDGPSAAQCERFSELLHRFPALRCEMAVHLYNEYRDIRESIRPSYPTPQANDDSEFATAYPPVDTPQDVYEIATLYRIEVSHGEHVDLAFDHAIQWADDDHGLNVLVKDWKIIDVAMEG
jgi:hypothetical protein